MNDMDSLKIFIAQRASKQNLSITYEKLVYVQEHISKNLYAHGEQVLYVGVGHGHDAVYCLLKGVVNKAVGVDPFLSDQGNPEDRITLHQLLVQTNLAERFQVVVSTIEDYLQDTDQRFSAIVMFDVLHHIFNISGKLSNSDQLHRATALAKNLFDHLEPGGVLLMQETEPWGLRQALTRLGLLGGVVDYNTKQHWRQWADILTGAGLRLQTKMVYIPWAIRRFSNYINNALGLYTVSDRVILVFNKSSNN